MWMKKSARPSAICTPIAAAFFAFVLSVSSAYATSERVKSACRDDYFRHCSAHALGSESLRQCMRNVGEGLSNPCLAALALDGEVTKADIERYQTRAANASKAASEQSPPKKSVTAVETGKGVKSVTTRKVVSKVAGNGKAAKGGKTSKVASVGKTASGAKSAKTGKTSKAASAAGKTSNGSKSASNGKNSKVASVGKTASHAKASGTSQSKKP